MAGVTGSLRRFTISVSGTNFVLDDPATGRQVTTALAGAATQTLNIFTLGGGQAVLLTKLKHRTSFTGGALTACTVEVGVAGATQRYSHRFNIFQAVADTGVARMVTKGGVWKSGMNVMAAAAGAVALAGTAVGDRVLGGSIVGGPQAGFTGAGSNQGGGFAGGEMIEPGIDVESLISVADQIQQVNAGNMSARSAAYLAEDGGGAESDAAAGTAVNALFRVAGGGATVNLLTAGVLDLWLFLGDAPQPTLGVG